MSTWSCSVCYYNFVRPHGALKFGREIRTPAMQAGLTTRRLTFRDIFLATTIPLWSRIEVFLLTGVLPPLSVGEMTLRLYAALNYSQNSARDFRRALNGA